MQQHDECTQMKSAAAALYDRYASSIFAYARLYTPSWEDAEDVTLEVFTAALEEKKLSALTERQQLVWLRRVAHNKLVDPYRRVVHLPAVPLEQVVETVRTEEALTPEQMVLRGEELERLYQAVRSLPLFQQQLLQLRFGEGLRFAEIAVLKTFLTTIRHLEIRLRWEHLEKRTCASQARDSPEQESQAG